MAALLDSRKILWTHDNVEMIGRRLLADGQTGRRLLLGDGDLSTGATAGYAVVCVVLIIFSGIMAGLTLGLLSLDKMDLEVIKRSGTEHEKWLVSKIEPVVARPHYLLATLLLCNAAAMETLPIFLDRLLNPLAAILISVTAILTFGEILPQAICKRYGLVVGAYLSWLVRLLMIVTGIISYPIGKLLDWTLGEESALYRRHELKAMVTIHAEPQDDGSMSALTTDEVQVIQGALDMATKTAESAMTPMEKVFMVSSEDVIDDALLHKVIAKGHSRVPVCDGLNRQAIIGLILVKELVLVDEDAGVKVRDLRIRELPCLRADIPLYDTLKLFRMGRSHMACLTRVATKQEQELLAVATGVKPVRHGKQQTLGTPQEVPGDSGHGLGQQRGSSFGRPRFFRPSPNAAAAADIVEEIIGIITIEDVLEELLGQEIVDETDQYIDNEQTIKTSTLPVNSLPPSLRRYVTRSSMQQGLHAPAAAYAAANGTPGRVNSSMEAAALAGALVAGGNLGATPGAVGAGAAVGAVVADSRAAQQQQGVTELARVDTGTMQAAVAAGVAVAGALAEAEAPGESAGSTSNAAAGTAAATAAATAASAGKTPGSPSKPPLPPKTAPSNSKPGSKDKS